MKEELDMLFLLEHFSLEDLVKAEEEYINYEYKNTDNIAESYYVKDGLLFNMMAPL